MEYVGLRWYKCDFHLHTMCSRCYKEQGDTVEMWGDSVNDAGLQCIATTDHNDYRGINKVKKLCEEKGIIVFPGVELSCSDSKMHMLIIFDCKCDETDVHEFLISVGVSKEVLGDSGRTCEGSIFEVCDKARKKVHWLLRCILTNLTGLMN